MKNLRSIQTNRGWVLYDGECRFCVTAARLCKPFWDRLGFDAATLQEPWVVRTLNKAQEERLSQMWMLTPQGILLGGIDAWLYFARRVWWGFPLRVIAALPAGKRVLQHCYLWLAARRYCIAGVCNTRQQIEYSGEK